MADCPLTTDNIQTIAPTECIGNSLNVINTNFSNLREAICNNFQTLDTANTDLENLTSLVYSLSGVVTPGAARAWVKFDSTRDDSGTAASTSTNRYIYSSYNISTVYRSNLPLYSGKPGYRITFTTPFSLATYAVIATSSEFADGNTYTWCQPMNYTKNFVDLAIHSSPSTNLATPTHVSVVVF